MGWQHGKGLGAKENGVTEHVKVSYKNDSKGNHLTLISNMFMHFIIDHCLRYWL